MSKIGIIKQELADFPVTYDALSDQEVSDELNLVDKVQNRASMLRQEVIDEINTAELTAMTGDDVAKVFGVLSDTVNPFSPVLVRAFQDAFAGGITISNLQAARIETVSRASQLGISRVGVGDVTNARAS